MELGIPSYVFDRLQGYLQEGPSDPEEEALARSLLSKLRGGDLELTFEEQDLLQYLINLGPVTF